MRNILVLLFVMASSSVVGRGATIFYEPTDIIDSTSGQDLWQYRYTVSDVAFDVDQGFSIEFDRSLYEDLQSPPPPVNGDWNVLTLQPDLLLPDDGFYDAFALVIGASLSDQFSVQFVYLGTGTPGSQAFTINQFDAQGNFESELDRGVTQLATPGPSEIPEPSTLVFALVGLTCLTIARRSLSRP